tara:strand:+ start:23076 stop:24272 length:1197 start_codon:yes stop_codon:yes gene_type:complete
MSKKTTHILTIGLVLSSVPQYSETFFRNKIKGLQKKGFRVVLFVDYYEPEDSTFDCEIVASPHFGGSFFKRLFYSFIVILKAVFFSPKCSFRLFKLNRVDGISLKANLKQLVLNQFFFSQDLDWLHFGFGMLAVGRENVATAMQANMAVSFRGYDLYLSPLKHPGCFNILFTKAVRYHVLSEEMKLTLTEYQISPSSIYVITPAIDTQFFNSNNHVTKSSIVQLITIGRLHWKKGFEYTLQALAYLKQNGIGFHYTIIGDGDEKERLIFAAHQLGILDNITFAGKLPQKEVKAKLEKAAIYIQYSIQEGFCNAVLEAQAMGLLCVVSDAEGLQENVLHAETGWVVTKRQPKLLANQLISVIKLSEKEKTAIQEHAIIRVRNHFNLNKQQTAFQSFYKL